MHVHVHVRLHVHVHGHGHGHGHVHVHVGGYHRSFSFNFHIKFSPMKNHIIIFRVENLAYLSYKLVDTMFFGGFV